MVQRLKKILMGLGAVAVLLVPGQAAYASGATLSLSPTSATVNQGCTFTVAINVDTAGAQTDGTDAILIYDPTRFSTDQSQIKPGTIYTDYPGNSVNQQTGRVTVSGLASVSSPFTGTGTLATVTFTVLPTAPAGLSQVTFDFDPQNTSKTTDSNVVQHGTVSDILGQVVNGNYTVGTGACGTIGKQPIGGLESTPSSVISTPLPTKTAPLPKSGSTEVTVALGVIGTMLVVFGVLGLKVL